MNKNSDHEEKKKNTKFEREKTNKKNKIHNWSAGLLFSSSSSKARGKKLWRVGWL